MSPREHFQTVEQYLSSLAPEVRKKLEELRAIIRQELPEAEEVISYNIPCFQQNGYIVYYSGYTKHISLYPASDDMVQAVPEIAEYRAGKGTLQFKLDAPLPKTMIRKVVQLLLEKNQQRQKK